jgi:glycosyltransferase involved in cell wall biosynthesis
LNSPDGPSPNSPDRPSPNSPDGPLRILTVSNAWPIGGGFQGIFVAELVDALRRLGHQVDVELVARKRGKLDYVTAGPRVRRRVRDGGYDIVHVHYGLTALAGCFTGPVPRVLSLHGSDVNTPWQRRFTRLGDHGYAARMYVSRRLADTAGDPAGVVLPLGVDFDVFRPVDQAKARADLGIGDGEKVVLFGGVPGNAVKGYDVYLEVLAALRARGIAVRELILPAAGQARSAVAAKMSAADALLFTSRQGAEGSPMVVKEAAAMGLPVVSVDVGDVAEVLAGVTPSAVVAFPESRAGLVDALATRLAEVLATGGRSNGRDRVAWLDSVRVAERVVEVYRTVLAGTPVRPARTG